MKLEYKKFFGVLTLGVLLIPQLVLAATAATGSITGVEEANLGFGETVTLHDGTNSYVFKIINNGGTYSGYCNQEEPWGFYGQPCVNGDNTVIDTGGGPSETDMVSRFVLAINTTTIGITASANGTTVDLVNDTAGTAGNQTITETVSSESFIVTGMSGGSDEEAIPEFTDYLYMITLAGGAWFIYSKIAAQKNNMNGLSA